MFVFKDKVVVVTGGAQGIGKCICERFKQAGAKVCVIDILENDYFVGDLANKDTLELFAQKVCDTFEQGIDECLEALDKQLEKHKDR